MKVKYDRGRITNIILIVLTVLAYFNPSFTQILFLFICSAITFKRFEDSLNIIYFIIPCIDIFLKEGSSFSLGTIIFLISFIKYIFTYNKKITIDKLSAVLIILIFIIEVMNILFMGNLGIVRTARWVSLFLYQFLLLVGKNINLNVENITKSMFNGAMVSIVCGIIGLLKNNSIDNGKIFRLEGVGSDPNGLSMIFIILILIYCGDMLDKFNIKCLMKTIFLIIGAMFTLSRTWFLTIGILAILFIVYKVCTTKGIKIKKIIIGSIILFIICILSKDIIEYIFELLLKRNESSGISNGRLDGYESYLKAILNGGVYEFLFGAGLFNFMIYYGFEIGTHNTILEVFMSWGIVGTIIFGGLIVRVIHLKYKAENSVNLIKLFPLIAMAIYLMTLQSVAKYTTFFLLLLVVEYAFSSNNKSVLLTEGENEN